MFVSDIEVPCLLGLDFLSTRKVNIYFRDDTMMMHGRELPLQLASPTSGQVRLLRTVIVPPKTEKIVECRMSKHLGGD